MQFARNYTVTRDGEEIPVQLTIGCQHGCKRTRESPAEPDSFEVLHCIDTRYGCAVELTEAETDEILDRAEEWAGEHCADMAASQADADYDARRDGDG